MIPIFNREVASTVRSVFEKPADEEPSRRYGGLTIALGATAMAGGILLNREVFDPMGFDQAAAWSGFAILIKGTLEYLQTIE